jgi:hypothetical protein
MQVKPEEQLADLLNKFRSKEQKYDCIVGLSGGRDSTYALWKLVKDYNMRVLAVNYDNPFKSNQAKENIDNTVKILNVDCISWGFPNNAHLKATQKHMKIWAKHPSSIMIPIVCAHCKSWWPGFFSIARKNSISLFVIGSNPLETASFKKAGFGGARTYHKISNIPKIVGKSFKEIVNNPAYLTTSWNMVLKMYLGASHSTPYMRWRYKDITVVRLFDYLKWKEKEVESIITRELKWRKSDEIASSWRFDCRLDYVRRLLYASTIGVTELRDLFSKMIREGQITREDALERLKIENTVSKDVVENVLNQLGMKMTDFNLTIDKTLLT